MSEIAFLSYSRCQNRKKKLPNRSTNNRDKAETAKREGVSLWHLCDYREAVLIKLHTIKMSDIIAYPIPISNPMWS